MPPRSPEPLRKTTINLFDADISWLERYYGRDWQVQVRELVREHRRELEARQGHTVDEIDQIYQTELEEDHG